jgi:hypothetical protein
MNLIQSARLKIGAGPVKIFFGRFSGPGKDLAFVFQVC